MKMYRCILLFLLSIAVAMVHAQCKRALVFGIGEYEDKSWNKINGDKDVDYAVEMLKVMGYTDIVTFKNSEATKVAMVEAFESLAKRCGEGDVVYIHYSGHGQMITDLNGDESFKWSGKHAMWDESWVPYDELNEKINQYSDIIGYGFIALAVFVFGYIIYKGMKKK